METFSAQTFLYFTPIHLECQPFFVFLMFSYENCFSNLFAWKFMAIRSLSFLSSKWLKFLTFYFAIQGKIAAWLPSTIIQWIEIETILQLAVNREATMEKKLFRLSFHPSCNNSLGFVSCKLLHKFTSKTLSVSPASFALQQCGWDWMKQLRKGWEGGGTTSTIKTLFIQERESFMKVESLVKKAARSMLRTFPTFTTKASQGQRYAIKSHLSPATSCYSYWKRIQPDQWLNSQSPPRLFCYIQMAWFKLKWLSKCFKRTLFRFPWLYPQVDRRIMLA